MSKGAPLSIRDLQIATAERSPTIWVERHVHEQRVEVDPVISYEEAPDSVEWLAYHKVPWQPPTIQDPVAPPFSVLTRIVLADALRLIEDLKKHGVTATLEQVIPSLAKSLEERWSLLVPRADSIDPALLIPVEHHEFRNADGTAVFGFVPRRDVEPGAFAESAGHGLNRVQLYWPDHNGWTIDDAHRLTLAQFDALDEDTKVVVAHWRARIAHTEPKLHRAATHGQPAVVRFLPESGLFELTEPVPEGARPLPIATFCPDPAVPDHAQDLHGLTLYQLHQLA